MSWMAFCHVQYHSRYNTGFLGKTEHNYSMPVLLLLNPDGYPVVWFYTCSQDLSTWILRPYMYLITPSPRTFPVSQTSHSMSGSHMALTLPGYVSAPHGWHSARCKSSVYSQGFQSRKVFLRTCFYISDMIQIRHPEQQMYLHLPEQFQVLHIFQLCCGCICIVSSASFVSSN